MAAGWLVDGVDIYYPLFSRVGSFESTCSPTGNENSGFVPAELVGRRGAFASFWWSMSDTWDVLLLLVYCILARQAREVAVEYLSFLPTVQPFHITPQANLNPNQAAAATIAPPTTSVF
jgi:hypothetical protein